MSRMRFQRPEATIFVGLPNHRNGLRRSTDHIRLNVPGDVRFWAGLWGLSDGDLHRAVAEVGPIAADVAAHLGQPESLSELDARAVRPQSEREFDNHSFGPQRR